MQSTRWHQKCLTWGLRRTSALISTPTKCEAHDFFWREKQIYPSPVLPVQFPTATPKMANIYSQNRKNVKTNWKQKPTERSHTCISFQAKQQTCSYLWLVKCRLRYVLMSQRFFLLYLENTSKLRVEATEGNSVVANPAVRRQMPGTCVALADPSPHRQIHASCVFAHAH